MDWIRYANLGDWIGLFEEVNPGALNKEGAYSKKSLQVLIIIIWYAMMGNILSDQLFPRLLIRVQGLGWVEHGWDHLRAKTMMQKNNKHQNGKTDNPDQEIYDPWEVWPFKLIFLILLLLKILSMQMRVKGLPCLSGGWRSPSPAWPGQGAP